MKKLEGTAEEGLWNFYGDKGKLDKTDSVFSLFTVENHVYTFIGTGFYISAQGLFMTAGHNVMAVCNEYGQPITPLIIIHLHENDFIIRRPVASCWNSKEADISIGVAEPMINTNTGEFLKNRFLTLTDKCPSIGDHIASYAFPNFERKEEENVHKIYLVPDFYDGTITDIHKKALGGPCYQTDMHIHGGASGGPVISNKNGCVFGINSNSLSTDTNISFVAPITPALKATIEKVKIEGFDEPTKMEDLIKFGHVIVK